MSNSSGSWTGGGVEAHEGAKGGFAAQISSRGLSHFRPQTKMVPPTSAPPTSVLIVRRLLDLQILQGGKANLKVSSGGLVADRLTV